jgi:hypothetical protein
MSQAMLDSPDELAMRCAQAVMHFTNLMAYLASPRIVAKSGQLPTQKHLLEHADEYLEVVAVSKGTPESPGNRSLIAAEPYARQLRELFRTWVPSTDVPPHIQQTARELLAAAGFGAPPEGWDAFEGPPEEKPAP